LSFPPDNATIWTIPALLSYGPLRSTTRRHTHRPRVRHAVRVVAVVIRIVDPQLILPRLAGLHEIAHELGVIGVRHVRVDMHPRLAARGAGEVARRHRYAKPGTRAAPCRRSASRPIAAHRRSTRSRADAAATATATASAAAAASAA